MLLMMVSVIMAQNATSKYCYHPEFNKSSNSHRVAYAYQPAVGMIGNARNCVVCHSDSGPWKNEGVFIVKDEKEGEDLQLTLDKVHHELLSHMGGDTYFVCANFKGKDGNLYDIDIFMKGSTQKDLK